jgi:hypothetical protein
MDSNLGYLFSIDELYDHFQALQQLPETGDVHPIRMTPTSMCPSLSNASIRSMGTATLSRSAGMLLECTPKSNTVAYLQNGAVPLIFGQSRFFLFIRSLTAAKLLDNIF